MGERRACEHAGTISELMSLALDGLLDLPGQQRMQEHLSTCPACWKQWEAMQQAASLFRRSPIVGPPLGFSIRVERRLAEKARKRRRLFGGVAVLTGSLSLAGITAVTVALILLGVTAWHWLGSQPSMQQEGQALSQVASGLGLMGKGASLFLTDALVHYGIPLLFLLGLSLALLAGLWAWLFHKKAEKSHHNGYA